MQTVVSACVLFVALGFVAGWSLYAVVYQFKVATDFGKEIARND